jgi:hypothetical protein
METIQPSLILLVHEIGTLGIYNSKSFIARAMHTTGVRIAAPARPKLAKNSLFLATAEDFL